MPSRLLFGAAIFLASFLLFIAEPLAARQLLPNFGGSAAVWMTCLVFFQTALLVGYLYAHLVTRRLRWWTPLHLALLSAASAQAVAWASYVPSPTPTTAHPVLAIFTSLTLSIGLPFLLLASTSPLLQVWFAGFEHGTLPYRLFALSNLASLLALGLYPSLIEPQITLKTQRKLWALGLLLFAAISAALTLRTRTAASPSEDPSASEAVAASQPRVRLLWFVLPLAASAQLSAVTGHLTTNVAAIPLLWILPLAVYLLTFIVAFGGSAPLRLLNPGLLGRLLMVMIASLAYILSKTDVSLPIAIAILFFLLELFLAGLLLHGATYALRPSSPRESTLFYLHIAGGGASGAFLVGIAAPLVFSANYDLVLSFLLTALLLLVLNWNAGPSQRLLWATGSVLLLLLIFGLRRAYTHSTLLATRNFYGSLRVKSSVTPAGDPIRDLVNGTIEHGTQIFTPALAHTPTTYYAPDSGIGLALENCCDSRPRNIGVVGLGAGTLAAYGRPGDRIRFYEINPAVLPIAQNLFTYLRDSPATLSFVEGDARASLTAETPQHFDVLVVDAFSGDAIPLHLLTTEAMQIYLRHLVPGGILAFHVSNQYVNLQPEIAAVAQASHLEARAITTASNDTRGEFRASWVLLTANTTLFDNPNLSPVALEIPPDPRIPLNRPWTDDYSSLLPALRW